MKPGVYDDLPMADYLAAPAVSAGMLVNLLTRCARAAWWESWLNPHRPDDASTKEQSAGKIMHSIILEGRADCCVVVDPKDHPNADKVGGIPTGWTNKAMKIVRETIIAEGKIPVLKADYAEIEAMVAAVRAYIESLRASEPAIWAAFQPSGGDSELTIAWDDSGTLCRMRPDRINKGRDVIVDLKSDGGTAEPVTWGKFKLFRMGYNVGAAFYKRGCLKAFGKDPDYYWLVVEQAAPYLCSLVSLEPAGFEVGAAKVARSLRDWAKCAKENVFPAYPKKVHYVELPPWELAEECEAMVGAAYDPAQMFAERIGLDREGDAFEVSK